jgi:hypothetical protein
MRSILDLIFTDIGEQNESLLQQQLQLAQTTVFESELFHEVSAISPRVAQLRQILF